MRKNILSYTVLIITVLVFYAMLMHNAESTIFEKLVAAFIDVGVIWIYFRKHRISKRGLAVIIGPLIYNFLYPFLAYNAVTLCITVISHVIILGTILFLQYYTIIKK